MEHILTIEESLAAGDGTANTEAFALIRETATALYAKLDAALGLTPVPGSGEFATYTSPSGEVEGSLNTLHGKDVDYCVYSFMESEALGFLNLHLNTWVAPTQKVPHLAIVFGTVPELFFYFDLVPRSDLMTDITALDKYWDAINDRYVAFHKDPRFSTFVSHSPYMRAAISPSGLCFTAPVELDTIRFLGEQANALMDTWLGWMAEGDPVPAAEQDALRARDELVRRTVAERDPANTLADKILGKELADQLVQALWVTGAGE